MSSIQKMTIQGIRSFGPDDSDKGLIEFYTPLTLILGPNGTGKTTIIECLKYITTGELPPGAKKDAAFVHDPKIAHETVVRSKVKLKFKDVKGQSILVERAIEATQKKAGVTSRTLEGLITRISADGSRNSIGHRCADLDAEMVNLLGVSKSVLDSVIFCHQEESNWPLSEGRLLKTRFDDIFASTRYVKALESITKLRKEQQGEVNVCKEGIKHYKHLRDQAVQLTSDLADKEGAYESAQQSMRKIDEQLQPIQDKLRDIDTRLGDIYDMNTEIEKLRTQKKVFESNVREIKEKIENEFQGSTEELRDALSQFENDLQNKNQQLEQVTKKLSRVERALVDLNEEKQRLLLHQGKLEQEAENHKRNIARRDKLIRDISNELNVSGFSGSIDELKVSEFLKRLEKDSKKQLEEAKDNKSKAEEQEMKLQKGVDAKNKEITELQTKKKMKDDNIRKNKDEIRRINQELSHVAASGDKLKYVERDLKRTEADLSHVENTVNLAALKEEITSLQSDRMRLNEKMTDIDSLVTRMSRESESRTKLELLTKDKTTKEDAIRRLKAKNSDSLKELLGEIPDENLSRQVQRKMDQHSRDMRTMSQKLDKMRAEVARLDTQKKHIREQISKTEGELHKHEEKIANICGSEDIEQASGSAQAAMSEAQDIKGYLLGTQKVFDKYVQKLSSDGDAPCPLCHRPFDSPEEIQELIRDLESKLRMLPDKLDQAETKINSKQRLHENILLLKPVKKEVDAINKNLPTMKSQLDKITTHLEKLNNDVTETEEQKDICASDESLARNVQGDVSMIDRYQTEIRDLQRKIDDATSKLSIADTEKSLQDVQDEREDFQLQLRTLDMTLQSKQKKKEDQQEQVQRLKTAVNELHGEKLKIKTALQTRVNLEQKRDQLETENEDLRSQVDDSADLIEPLQVEIAELMSERTGISEAKERKWEEDRSKHNELRGHRDSVEMIQDELQRYLSSGKEAQLGRGREKMEKVEQNADKIMNEKTELSERLEKLRQDIAEQQTRERELSDNLSCRQKDEEIRMLSERIRQKEERMGGLDVNNLQTQKDNLRKEGAKFTSDKHRQEGRVTELEEAIRRLRKDLRNDDYKDAETKYRIQYSKLRTTELAIGDLDKYYKAMDRAIMSYHGTKMDEINKIIRELWRNTYKGNDIETIEVRSDEDTKAATATARKSYNYRVVMIKGDNTALDMRGRCSAGQKVLASLIIRLALAETFCLNCGILALDEPTTNLDRENIESLAYALVEIIKARASQKNFQLVVITHDEDFVELLGRSNYVDEFFKVRKDQLGCSRLVKAKVQDLHTR